MAVRPWKISWGSGVTSNECLSMENHSWWRSGEQGEKTDGEGYRIEDNEKVIIDRQSPEIRRPNSFKLSIVESFYAKQCQKIGRIVGNYNNFITGVLQHFYRQESTEIIDSIFLCWNTGSCHLIKIFSAANLAAVLS